MLVTTVDTAPAFTPEDAAALARRLYGIDGRATPLPSERDQNFRLDADGARYVLKIANPAEDEAVLELQNAAMTRLAAQDLHVAPAVVPSQACTVKVSTCAVRARRWSMTGCGLKTPSS